MLENGMDLVSCSNVTHVDTSYCCATQMGCCDSGVGRFEVLPAQPNTWAVWDSSKTLYSVVTPLPTSSSSSSSAISTSSATSSAASTTGSASRSETSATDTSGASRLSTQTGPPEQAATNSNTPTTGASQSSGLSTAAQAGIGAGAAVGALLVAAVAYMWWKMQKMQQGRGGPSGSDAWQGSQDAYPTDSVAAPQYYPQDPRRKVELYGNTGAHELQGHHTFVQGDVSGLEQPSYGVESPVVLRGHQQ